MEKPTRIMAVQTTLKTQNLPYEFSLSWWQGGCVKKGKNATRETRGKGHVNESSGLALLKE